MAKCMPKAMCIAREVPKGETNNSGAMHKGSPPNNLHEEYCM